ncbi:MAG: bifunctional 4-hydroxy-2-oxoglutarate aldolase/2-dehydro-3-deoxy-phosphogluconate aldolase, partial [Bacteroidales bacterium]|nr:bifunctional 4-hydroxy-2-oxoglutarate aldolase/2-dehydro-3-deoxy-phosphogluconate aldolase [Bacteroidales bacterium]
AGSVGGPAFVRDVLAPLPRVKLMCPGSVEPLEENVRAWAAAGAAALGMGSKLFPKEAIAEGAWDHITQLCSSSLKWFALYHK